MANVRGKGNSSVDVYSRDLTESENLESPDKQAIKEENDFKRSEEIKGDFHHYSLLIIRIACYAIVAIILVRLIHFIIPDDWRWLLNEDLQLIDKFLFSGVLGALIGRNINKIAG